MDQVLQDGKVSQGGPLPNGGQGDEVPMIPPELNDGEIMDALLGLAKAMNTHVTRYVGTRMNVWRVL